MAGLINPSALVGATRTVVDSRVKKAYASVEASELWYNMLAEVIPGGSTSAITLYLEHRIPRLRKWVGARIAYGIKRIAQTLTFDDYEETIGINLNDIEDDQLQVYNSIMDGLGRSARLWPNDMAYLALVNGSTAVCVDGQPFFNGSHPYEPQDGAASTQSNLHTTMALTVANYGTVRQRMMMLKGEDGDTLGVAQGQLVLAVPTELGDTAKRIVEADLAGYLANNSSTASDSNVYKNTSKVLVIPKLSTDSATTWYLVDPNAPLKPFIVAMRKEPNQVVSCDRPTDPKVFDTNTAYYGVHGRAQYGYGLWQFAHKCTA